MKQLKTIDKNFSTTRLAYRLLPEDYLDERGRVREGLKFKINLPELGIVDSKIPKQGEEKFDTYLFLPPGEGRQGEGGLRTRGYFKFSYEVENGRWYACDFRGKRLFEVDPPEGLDIELEEFKSNNGIIRLPLITVITVVLNGEKYLEETIRSVINQTYPNVEYIIIDGGSTDGTLDIIKKYENQLDYWVSEKDKGIYDAMNKGIDCGFGDFFCFLGSDDILDLLWFENAVRRINLTKIRINYIYGNIIFIINKGKSVKYKYNHINPFELKKEFKIPHSGSLQHRSLFSKTRFDNIFKIAGDYDFLLGVLEDLKPKYIDLVQLKMRLGGISNNFFYAKEVYKELLEIERKRGIKLNFFYKSKYKIKMFFSLNPLLYKILQFFYWKFRK